jgi:hypothetical protein
MCLLAFHKHASLSRAQLELEREALLHGCRFNPDGFGGALLTAGGLITFRSMDAAHAVELYFACRLRHPAAPAMFHSRHATGSLVSLGNCHPLPVGGDPQIVMAHNGYLFEPADPDVCDSVIFADTMLPRYQLANPAERAELERRIGRNKVIVFDGRAGDYYMLNEACGIWDDGVWYSNMSYTGVSHITPGVCALCRGPASLPVPGGGDACEPCYGGIRTREQLLLQPVPGLL